VISFNTLDRVILLTGSILLASLAACGEGDTSTREGAPVDTAASSAPSSGDTSEAAVKTYVFHGTPTAIDTARNMITIEHEKIGDYMEAMTMPFKVADPALLTKVAVGRSTHFTLRVAGSRALIVDVKDDHDPGHEH
jgi:Cu/Ag efflux protein CusF